VSKQINGTVPYIPQFCIGRHIAPKNNLHLKGCVAIIEMQLKNHGGGGGCKIMKLGSNHVQDQSHGKPHFKKESSKMCYKCNKKGHMPNTGHQVQSFLLLILVYALSTKFVCLMESSLTTVHE
jgi:hypothetical protein